MNRILILFLFISNTAFSQIAPNNVVKDTVYVNPEYPGGATQMFQFMGKNLRYPANSRNNGIMGILYVGFIVDSTGKIQDPIIKKQKLYKLKKKNVFSKAQLEEVESDAEMAEECLRIVKLFPNWKPGSINGKFVPVAYTLPIKFSLE
jgi:protein TonB